MRLWQKGWLVLAAFTFLLLLIGGFDRLVGHEEPRPVSAPEALEVTLAAPAAVQLEPVMTRQFRTEPEYLHCMEALAVPKVRASIRTDANGTVISGRRSYLHIRYQAFSLSDGFV